MTNTQVSDSAGVQRLVSALLSESRKKPACVITIPFNQGKPVVTFEDLGETADVCDFYLIENSDLTREFAALMPANTSVFNGSIKVYPVAFSTETDPFSLPIFHLKTDSQKLIDSVVNEIWARADVSSLKSAQLSRSTQAAAKVIRFFDARAMVQLDNGVFATIRQEISFPGVPLEWIFKTNDKVTGRYDAEDGAFIPDSAERTIKDVAEAYGVGSVVLALVSEIGRQTGKVRLLPNVEVEIKREEISHNERDLVEDLVDVGDVVSVRLYRHDEGAIRVRMDDIDDDEVVLEALPLVAGGMPWLVEGRDVPGPEADGEIAIADEAPIEYVPLQLDEPELPTTTGGIPLPGPGMLSGMAPTPSEQGSANALALAQFSAKQYRKRLDDANQLLMGMTDQANDFKQRWIDAARERDIYIEQIRKTSKTVKKSRLNEVREDNQRRSDTWSRRDRWDDDADWFNEELRRSWVSRYSPSERRGEYTLEFEKFTYSPHFFDSMREIKLDEEGMRKATRVILDIVTGRENKERRYDLHPLLGGGSSPLVREDGAESFRAYLEQGTPQARRLHFYKLGNNRFEISRVVLHDDYRP